MLFDKNLFESKYVPAEQRTPVDTLILIGNGFDIWQNLDTSYRSFERYYEAHLDEVLERFHLKKYTKYNDDGTIAIDSEGNTITYSDVELLVTISRPTAYGEYAPYTFIEDEKEFEKLVQKM